MLPILLLIAGYYGFLSACSLRLYAHDKHRARRGGWRVRERTLHTVDLLGGWPGAWVARRVLRHKSSKQSFSRVYFATVSFHVLLWIGALALTWRWSR